MTLSKQTIGALAKPFEDGGGPPHSSIELIFTAADADAYLGEGSKLKRVLDGLNALRDGGRPEAGRRAVGADREKLRAVAADLAQRLVADGLVEREAVREALEGPRTRSSGTTRAAGGAGVASPQPSVPEQRAEPVAADPRVVMLIYGRDDEFTRPMFDWLRALDLRPGEWGQLVRRSGHASPYIGQVLEVAFKEAQAVVALFTPDEHVRLRDELASSRPNWHLQARPNVLFEAGMAFALHPERTILVVAGDAEIPSDLAGRHYVRLGDVRALRDLAARLDMAGCPVDDSGDDWLDVDRFPDRRAVDPKPRP